MFRFNIGLLLLVLQLAAFEARTLKWSEYKTRFGKKYQNTNEEAQRQAIYQKNRELVESLNAAESSFQVALNDFSDETLEETLAKRTGLKRSGLTLSSSNLLASSNPVKAVAATSYPTSLSYMDSDLVSDVKNQGECGSCWAFAVAQAVEAQTVKTLGRMISPSEQQLVDCDKTNYGCDGGILEYAYGYMSGGVQNDTTYPYVSGSSGDSNQCSASKSLYVVATKASTYPYYKTSNYGYDFGAFVSIPDSGNGDLSANFLNLTIAALNDIGPLSIGVCVGNAFNIYSNGIYSTSRCTNNNLNHAILLVGYDRSSSDSSKHYWIAKNQWGTSWGDDGYIYMQMGKGLIRESMFPVLSDGSTTPATTRTSRTTASRTPRTTASRTTTTTVSRTPRTTASRTPRTTVSRTPRTTVSRTPRTTVSRTPRTTVSRTPRTTVSRTPRTTVSRTPRTTVSRTTRIRG